MSVVLLSVSDLIDDCATIHRLTAENTLLTWAISEALELCRCRETAVSVPYSDQPMIVMCEGCVMLRDVLKKTKEGR